MSQSACAGQNKQNRLESGERKGGAIVNQPHPGATFSCQYVLCVDPDAVSSDSSKDPAKHDHLRKMTCTEQTFRGCRGRARAPHQTVALGETPDPSPPSVSVLVPCVNVEPVLVWTSALPSACLSLISYYVST